MPPAAGNLEQLLGDRSCSPQQDHAGEPQQQGPIGARPISRSWKVAGKRGSVLASRCAVSSSVRPLVQLSERPVSHVAASRPITSGSARQK